MSSVNVSRHVCFGLPHLLHPPSGVQSIISLAGLDVGTQYMPDESSSRCCHNVL